MGKKATVRYRSLRTNLVHLPLSLYASLVQQQAVSPGLAPAQGVGAPRRRGNPGSIELISQRPQSIVVHLNPLATASSSRQTPKPAYLGWSGLAAASSLAEVGTVSAGGLETVEVDPEVAMSLGWVEGSMVSQYDFPRTCQRAEARSWRSQSSIIP